MSSKLKTLKRHARRRFQERFGIPLTGIMERAILTDIRRGEAVFVEKQSFRVTVWDVTLAIGVVRVVYDKARGCLITVLPPTEADINDDDVL